METIIGWVGSAVLLVGYVLIYWALLPKKLPDPEEHLNCCTFCEALMLSPNACENCKF